MVSGTKEQLEQRMKDLQNTLDSEQGRGKKGRRRSLRKQLDTIERRIQRVSA